MESNNGRFVTIKNGDEENLMEEHVTYEHHPDGGVTEHRT